MKKNVKITLSGGFHNSSSVNAIIPADSYEELKTGWESLQGVLSGAQLKRLNRHFCGVRGCLCGGVARASWDLAN